MVRKLLGSVATLLAGAGLAWGQTSSGPQLPTAPQAVQPAGVQQTAAAEPPPATLPSAVGQTPNTIPAPIYQNPTNDWANPSPSRGSVYLTQPYSDNSRLWFQAEYLLWWIRPGSLPPVVGTAPTNQVATGSLESNAITPLLGSDSNNLDYHEQSGVRFSVGGWLDNSQCWGVDASYFRLEQKTLGATFSSSGDPVIGPIFFDPNTNERVIVLASLPNFTSGPLAGLPRTAVITANSENRLWGAEANVRKQVGAVFFADHLDVLMGLRYLEFSEGVNLVTDSDSGPGSVAPSTLHVEDHLGVHNQFYGAQVGLASHTQVCRWSFDAIFKVALGDMHEVTNISGSTQLNSAALNVATNTGILAEPTNIGKTTRDRFAVLPELTLNVGYQVMEHVRVTGGYNFLYINSVTRAGDLVDGVDARQVRSLSTFDPTAQVTHPAPQQAESRFWAQGFNLGFEVRY